MSFQFYRCAQCRWKYMPSLWNTLWWWWPPGSVDWLWQLDLWTLVSLLVCWFWPKAKLSEEVSLWLLLTFLNMHKHKQHTEDASLTMCNPLRVVYIYFDGLLFCTRTSVLFSPISLYNFSPVALMHPWRARRSLEQGARGVDSETILPRWLCFTRTCVFGNPRPLKYLTWAILSEIHSAHCQKLVRRRLWRGPDVA